MTLQQQIQSLEALGITRYRISCDTGINQATLLKWIRGVKPRDCNSNVQKLHTYYEKIMKGEKLKIIKIREHGKNRIKGFFLKPPKKDDEKEIIFIDEN
jgi:hypothetical protein